MKSRNLLVKIVTVVLFSLLILSFAIWGIGDMFRSAGRAEVLAEVGKTTIGQREYAQELSREINAMSQRLGVQLTMDQARAFGIPQQVLERMITRALLDEMSARMGMLVTEEQMRKQLLDNPDFKNAQGQFDRNRFAQLLRYANMSEQTYLARVGQDIKRQQLVAALTDAAVAPASLGERLFAYREERRQADYVSITDDSFTDIGEPDEAALQKIYDEAGSDLMTPAYKKITLAVLSVAEAAKGISVSDERIAEAFEAQKATLSTPERRTVKQAVLADEAAAKALAGRISEGADFDSAVQQATGRPPVELGAVAHDDLPPELADAIFALNQGQTTAPVQSPLGWHVAMVTAIEPGKEATLAEHRDALRSELATADAVDIVIKRANEFDQKLAGGVTIEQAAQSVGGSAQEIPAIDAQGRRPAGAPVAGLPSLNEFLPVLNRTAVGESSTLSETLEGDYFIIRVDGETPAEKKPLAEVRDQVAGMWRAQEQARLAQEKATALADKVKAGETLAAVAEAEGLDLRQTEAVTRFENNPLRTPSPQLSQQLFEIAQGEVTTVTLGTGQIVAQLQQILPPEPEARDVRLAQVETQITGSIKNDVFQQFLSALHDEFDVTVNQRLVQETLASF